MRKYALIEEKNDDTRKVMIYDSSEGAYVFLYDTTMDVACIADYWFESLEEAEAYCESLGVKNNTWIFIDDPLDGCQHDLIKCI